MRSKHALFQCSEKGQGGALGYAWLFSHPNAPTRQQRLSSQRNLQVIQALIQQTLRISELTLNAKRSNTKTEEQLYQEADNKYGHKLFLSLGKNWVLLLPIKARGPVLL